MCFKAPISALALAALALAPVPASAQALYSGLLSGVNEIPPVATSGNGQSSLTINLGLETMRVQASFSDLIGTVTAAHVHCCTAIPFIGNVGVATQTPSFIGFPTGVQAGSYDHVFDMSLASSYNAGFITANGGTVDSAFDALTAGLDSGRAYFNLHSTRYPAGEIRAPLAPIPEASSQALMLAGLASLGVLGALGARRRKALAC